MKLNRLFVLLFTLAALASFGCDDKKTTETTPDTATEEPKQEEPKEEVKKEEPKEEPAEDGTQWVKSDAYGVKFKVPEDWKILKNEQAVSVTSPDDTITIIVVGTESTGVFETAMASISNEIKIKELKTEKSQITVINGIGGFFGSGSAVLTTDDGDQGIQFLGYALKTDGEKGVAMMVFAEAEMYEARKEELEAIAKTIQKV